MSDLRQSEKRKLESFLEMGGGYVLNFSNRTFRDFIIESVELDIDDPVYESGGTSKANRLRTFWSREANSVVGKLLFDLIQYAKETITDSHRLKLAAECEGIVRRLQQSAEVQYDVCLSFAGEDRSFVEQVADGLRGIGVRVFYDQYERADLWGKDLYQHLAAVYRQGAAYCVVFISKHYAAKVWTRHELKSAQARAFRENREYILPVRFDDTELPGLQETVGYIDLRTTSPAELVQLIQAKLRSKVPPSSPSKSAQPSAATSKPAMSDRSEIAAGSAPSAIVVHQPNQSALGTDELAAIGIFADAPTYGFTEAEAARKLRVSDGRAAYLLTELSDRYGLLQKRPTGIVGQHRFLLQQKGRKFLIDAGLL